MARRRAQSEPTDTDVTVYLRRVRCLELRIACEAIDTTVPGAHRWMDDPAVARRLAAARAEVDALRRAAALELLARDLMGDERVDAFLNPSRGLIEQPNGGPRDS